MAPDLSAPTEDKSMAANDTSVCPRPLGVPVDKFSYLVIEPNGGYSISDVPKEIPEDVYSIKLYDDTKGLRRIIVRRHGSVEMEVVHVGTMMIQNGYAYIAGTVICEEEPSPYLDKIYFPPFVITFPLVSSDDEAREHYEKNQDEIRENLVSAIKAHNYVAAKFRCLDFDYDFDGEPDLFEKNLCAVCEGQIYGGGYEFCKDCGDILMRYYSCKNHKEVWNKVALKMDKDGDIGDREDICKGLVEKPGSTQDVGPSKQTSSSVN